MKRLALLAAAAAAATAAASSSGCWPGWDFLFDQTPSREHRVEDLRVLAVVAEPASLVLAPAVVDVAEPEPAPVPLRVRAEIFEPRGGQFNVSISICAVRFVGFEGAGGGFGPPAAPNGFACGDAGGTFAALERTVDAAGGAGNALGRTPVEVDLALDRATILGLFAGADVDPRAFGGITVNVVVNVTRDFDGKRESERAELGIGMRVDPFGVGIDDEERAAIFAAGGVVECAPEVVELGQCFPGEAVPECGDGVVEQFEECDPPDDVVCGEGCFALDFCFAQHAPPCGLPPVENRRPLLRGIVVGEDNTLGSDFDAFTEPGGVVGVPVGGVVFVSPSRVPLEDGARELVQPTFASDPFGCPPDAPAAQPRTECPFDETQTFRVYIGDRRAELVSPSDGISYVGNSFGGAEAVGVSFADGTAVGTQEPLVLVVSDGRGGMDLAELVIEAR